MKDAVLLEWARKVVAKQAKDEGLWFEAQYITEEYLQIALRLLHAVIENDMEFILRNYPDIYEESLQ